MHSPLHDDARSVWTSAIEAVRPERLVASRLSVTAGGELRFDDHPLAPPVTLRDVGSILVVGGGKAAAGMAAGIERLLGDDLLGTHHARGLVSVPEGCGRSLVAIEVRETRPTGSNLPTPNVVAATREMLGLVSSASPRDLVIAVITGGGSALVAMPREGVSLEEKIAATKQLSAAGATIAELNAARRRMSLVKGGGLARACAAGRLIAIVLSDVIESDLETIASGPCMPGDGSSPTGRWTTPTGCTVSHLVVGDNATAVTAAAEAAGSRGYDVAIRHAGALASHESAETVGRRLASEGLALLDEVRRTGRARAIIEGGEATVTVPAEHGIGGRNQQTVLAAVDAVMEATGTWPEGLLVASIGTDGEDGPTDAAGGFADAEVVAALRRHGIDPPAFLARCDAFPALAAGGGLIHTGPTGTNVADVRIVLAR